MERLFFLFLLLFVLSCGGGGGSSEPAEEVSVVKPTAYQEVSEPLFSPTPVRGYFYSSRVKGLTVCAGSDCAQTDSSGYFELKNTVFKGDPVNLKVYAGGVKLGEVSLVYNGQRFNPVVLAGGDGRVGALISAFIHALGGDEGGFSEEVEVSATVKNPPSESLVEVLKGGGELSLETADGRLLRCSLKGVEVCEGGSCVAVPLRTWAVVYYGAGDNTLSSFVEEDLREMEQVELPPEVSLVAFVDRRDGTYSLYDYDHSQKKLVEVERGEREVDSANLSTFYITLSELIARHPAQHYLVVVSSHGDGLRAPSRFVALDENPAEILYNWAFKTALKWLKENGYPVDLLALDQCLGGSSELLYAVKDFVNYGVVASEYAEPAQGWPYRWLEVFSKNPSSTPEEVGRAIVDAFKGFYSNYGEDYFVEPTHNLTLAYYPVEFVRSYSKGVEEFSEAAKESSFTKRLMGEVRKALYPVESYDGYGRVDAYGLWKALLKKLSWRWSSCLEEDGEEVCRRVKTSLENLLNLESLVYAYHYKGAEEGLGEGLPSIFFPFSSAYSFYFTSSEDGLGYYNPFVESGWPELLEEIYSEGYQITRPDYAY